MHLYNSIKINNITNNELNIDAIIKNKNIKNINDIYPDFNWEIYTNQTEEKIAQYCVNYFFYE